MTSIDLLAAIRAALDETERIAQAADVGRWEVGPAFGALDNRVYVRDNRVYVRREGDLIDSVGICVIAGQVSNVPRWRGNAGHITHHDPAAVLRRVAADREIVAEHSPHRNGACPVCWRETTRSCLRQDYPCLTLTALARGLGIDPQEET